MRIGVPREPRAGERLVAATPRTVTQLRDLGHDVVVQRGAGEGALLADEEYARAGAALGGAEEVWASDVVVCVNPPDAALVGFLAPGSVLVTMLAPAARPELVQTLAARGVTALALDAVPRISRAQSLDVLSTLANVAGYRSVVEAAHEYAGMLGGQVTAAGSTPPAKVFVIGAGVAGLAAIAAATRLGAHVRAFDVRAEVGEQIRSLGADVVQVAAVQQAASSDGYARALSSEQERLTAQTYARETADADVVITTALVRGRAPTTITAAMVAAMRPGSVVVDLAASGGGNCEATVPGTRVMTDNGVAVLGWTDLPSRVPRHTSQLVSTNIVNLVTLLTPGRDGRLVLDLEDPVQRGMTVTSGGQVLWPPPPVAVSAAVPTTPPAAAGAPPPTSGATATATVTEPGGSPPRDTLRRRRARRTVLAGTLALLLTVVLAYSPAELHGHVMVFALAVVVGYYVISHVTHALHTPLMAQTNAVSGIILVGALLQIGSSSALVTALAFVAATVASINIFGGFLVAHRMIRMFRKDA